MHTYDWKIAGHEKQRAEFEADLNSGNIAHAYLLFGALEVGKFRFAKTCANILQCKNGLCGTCPTCRQIDTDAHFDTLVLKDDGNGITIEEVKNIIHRLSLTSQSAFKIVIIEDIERMSHPAQHALLKTLEEPGENTIFFLTTNNLSSVLDTIRSRTRMLKFGAVSNETLKGFLHERGELYDPVTLNESLTFAFGSVGAFFRLLQDDERRKDRKTMYETFLRLLDNSSVSTRFKYINTIASEPSKVYATLEMLSHILRSRLLSATSEKAKLIKLIELNEKTKNDIESNCNTKLALENEFLHF